MAIERDQYLGDDIANRRVIARPVSSIGWLPLLLLAAFLVAAYIMFMPRQATITAPEKPTIQQRTVPAPAVPTPAVPIVPKQQ